MYKSITVIALAAVFALTAIPGYAEGTDGAQKVAAQVHQGQGIVNKMDLIWFSFNVLMASADSGLISSDNAM